MVQNDSTSTQTGKYHNIDDATFVLDTDGPSNVDSAEFGIANHKATQQQKQRDCAGDLDELCCIAQRQQATGEKNAGTPGLGRSSSLERTNSYSESMAKSRCVDVSNVTNMLGLSAIDLNVTQEFLSSYSPISFGGLSPQSLNQVRVASIVQVLMRFRGLPLADRTLTNARLHVCWDRRKDSGHHPF